MMILAKQKLKISATLGLILDKIQGFNLGGVLFFVATVTETDICDWFY